ncbi:conjugative transfer system coupling protein TraD [Vibrio barjaei]|uniref:conjugative transfer system coupling protein TraD n=1 Tax=Vibrio barjaei TaxID=1676683 RepID=UPI00228378A2|nr:conjugative transfer system coupling protein TraD [Vibrio barjaei]MCY9872362.1 conjugative transfer system coupling protein TraD [Vibrio barjaei]
MSTEVKLDGFLRPIYEFWSATFSASVALLLYGVHDLLNVSYNWMWLFVIVLVVWAIIRTKQGYQIRKYQQGLNVIDAYKISTDTIPYSSNQTWIGRGFNWTAKHSQRVYDTKKEHLKKYYRLSAFFLAARANEKAVEFGSTTNPLRVKIAKLTQQRTWWKFKNPIQPIPDVGGNSAYHASGLEEETDQHVSLDERNGNVIVLGQSRVGKTRLLEILVAQDIARKDGVVAVFDPKSDAELLARMWAEAKRCGRDDEFYVFVLGAPDISAKYNSIANFSRISSVAGRISDEMSGGGDAAVFKDFAWRFLLLCASALIEMGERPTIRLMKKYIEDLESLFVRYAKFSLKRDNPYWEEEYREAQKPKMKKNANGELVEQKIKAGALSGRDHETILLDKLLTDYYERNPAKLNDTMEGLRSAMRNDVSYYNKITASLLPLLVKLTSGRISELLSPTYSDVKDNRPILTWSKLIQRRAVVYCGFDAMTDNVVASAVGSQFFGDFISSVSGEAYKHGVNKGQLGAKATDIVPLWIHMDEFQSLIGSDSIISILNRAAGSGSRLTAYSQTTADITEAFGGDQAKADVVLGNFNSVIMLRVARKETAMYLTDKIGACDLYGVQVKGSVTDSGKIFKGDTLEAKTEDLFKSSFSAGVVLEANEPLISPATIMSLPKGQAFAFFNGERLVKLRFPLLDDAEGYEVESVEVVHDELKRKYRLPPYDID